MRHLGYIVFGLALVSFSYANTCKSLDIPFIKQPPNLCGPVAVAEVLDFYKDKTPFKNIVKAVYTPSIKESLITDIEDYLNSKGFKVLYIRSLKAIKNQISMCRPVIALIDMGNFLFSLPHYVVITSYNKDGFFMNDGYHKDKFMSFKDFRKRFKSMGNVAISVYK